MEQRTKAESDPAVAAASILAREGFVNWLEKRGRTLGVRLGRGVSEPGQKNGGRNCGGKGCRSLGTDRKSPFSHGARGGAGPFCGSAAAA